MIVGPHKIAALVGVIVFSVALVIGHQIGGNTGLLILVSIFQVAIVVTILNAQVTLRRHVDFRAREVTKIVSKLEQQEDAGIKGDLANLKGELKRDQRIQRRNFNSRFEEGRQLTDRGLRQVEKSVTSHTRITLQDQYHQIEALLALYHDIRPKESFPQLRDWVASPDLLHYVYRRIVDDQSHHILELGSGVSTLVMAYALQRVGRGKIVALDHNDHFRDVTATQLERHGLSNLVDLRLAPLKPIEVDGETYFWYSTSALPKDTIDLVFVDGPPGDTQSKARYPALPLTHSLLSKQAVVILDDYAREDEREVATRWLEQFPELTLREVHHEKGTAVLEAGVR